MICKQCGATIPDTYLKKDAFRCPQCGKPYRRRSTQTTETSTKQQKKSRQGSLSDRKQLYRVGAVLLAVLTVLNVVMLVVNINISKRIKDNPVVDTTTIEPTIEPTIEITSAPDDSESWSTIFKRTEQEVAAYVESIIPYDLALEVLMDYREEGVYVADASPILKPPTVAELRKCLHSIESELKKSPYNIELSLMVMRDENAGICLTYLGKNNSTYRVVIEGKAHDYQSIDDIPNNLF